MCVRYMVVWTCAEVANCPPARVVKGVRLVQVVALCVVETEERKPTKILPGTQMEILRRSCATVHVKGWSGERRDVH